MTLHRITWTIDLDAATPQEAAEKALTIQRNPESIATVFRVSADGQAHDVDLTEGTVTPAPESPVLTALERLLIATAPGEWDRDLDEETAAWAAGQAVVDAFNLSARTPVAEIIACAARWIGADPDMPETIPPEWHAAILKMRWMEP